MYLFTQAFWLYAFERMVKTIAQVMIATITASTFLPLQGEAWLNVLVTSGLAGLVSILTSLTSYSAAASVSEADQAVIQRLLEAQSKGDSGSISSNPDGRG